MGNFCLSEGIPWITNTDDALCFVRMAIALKIRENKKRGEMVRKKSGNLKKGLKWSGKSQGI